MDVQKAKRKAIGVFDSGVGGLTVVRSIRKYLPCENILYFGDTARVPYGNKSRETVKRFSREIMDFLIAQDVKFIVAACNTVSSLAMPFLKRQYKIPVLGVVNAGVDEAKRITQNGKIGVIGTVSTISSGAYERALKKKDRHIKVFSNSCPLFVPLVENGMVDDRITFLIAEKYLKVFKDKDIDTIIMGCTHYPVLRRSVKKVLKNVKIVDSASSVAKKAKFFLAETGQLSSSGSEKKGIIRCFVSDDPHNFKKISNIFLKEKLIVKKVVL